MAEAKRDGNFIPTLLAVSNADGDTPVTLYADPTTHRLLVSATAGALDDLSDVVITSPTGSQALVYNSGSSTWVNETITASIIGTSTYILFFDGANSPKGDAGFTYNKTTDSATLVGSLTVGTGVYISANDGGALGISGAAFSDLFLASGSVIDFAAGDVTLTHGANVITLAGGNLALGANSLTMTGSIAATGARVTKGWFTDLESSNMPTVGGTVILTSLTAPQFTSIELSHATANTLTASGGILSIEGVAIPTVSSTDELDNKTLDSSVGKGTWTASGTWTLPAITLGGTVSGGGQQLNNIIIGTVTPLAGSFTTVSASSTTTLSTIVGIGGAAVAGIALTVTGSSRFSLAPAPTTNDGAALGNTSLQWSDLFLAEGGVINWDGGDLTLTQTNNELVLASGNLDIGANTLRLAGPLDYTVEPASNDTFEGPSTNDIAAAAAIGTWNLVYLNPSGHWAIADADAAATAGGMLGIAATANVGSAITVALPGSIARHDTWAWTAGTTLYISTTAGSMTSTQPSGTDDVIRVVGFALTDDSIFFNPSSDYITHT